MKEFVVKYYKEILIAVFGVVIIFLLLKVYGKTTDNSDLIKFKMEILDKEINELYNQRKSLDSSINLHNENIKKIDKALSGLKIEKTTINKFYQIKENEIKGADAKKVDSLLRLRYGY